MTTQTIPICPGEKKDKKFLLKSLIFGYGVKGPSTILVQELKQNWFFEFF